MTVRLTMICQGATRKTIDAAFGREEEPLLDFAPLPRRATSFNRVSCAPGLAARQTATRLGVAAVDDPRLRDLDVGRWTGLQLDDLSRNDPCAFAMWLSDPDSTVHGGESLRNFLVRIGAWMDSVAESDSATLAIASAAVIRAALVHSLQTGPPTFWRIDITPLSRTSLRSNFGRWNLIELARRS